MELLIFTQKGIKQLKRHDGLMNRDKKLLFTFLSALVGTLLFASANNWLVFVFKRLIETPLRYGGLLHWLTSAPILPGGVPLFPHPYAVGGYWGSSDMAADFLGFTAAVLLVIWPVYLGIKKIIWKK